MASLDTEGGLPALLRAKAGIAASRHDGGHSMIDRDVKPANVNSVRPGALPAERIDELVRGLWRWAAWACPDGVPNGWSQDERPEEERAP